MKPQSSQTSSNRAESDETGSSGTGVRGNRKSQMLDDPRIDLIVDAIATEVFARPVRVLATDGYANLIDANGRYRLAHAILDALDHNPPTEGTSE